MKVIKTKRLAEASFHLAAQVSLCTSNVAARVPRDYISYPHRSGNVSYSECHIMKCHRGFMY